MNSRFLTVGLLCLSLLLLVLLTRSGDLAWIALPFLTYLGAGILGAPATEKIHLSAERTLAISDSNGNTEIEVTVAIHNQGVDATPVWISDTHPSEFKVTDGSLRQVSALGAGETAELRYRFQTGRGEFAWKSIQVRTGDALGLFETTLTLPAEGEIRIQPRVRKFRPIPLRPEITLHSPGSIPAHIGGSGTDFWGVREYHPGDPLRRIDWRLTARHPRQFFTKEFELEEIADIGLILDARMRNDLRIGEDSLFERSVAATASLAEMFIHQGNRVSLLIFSDPMTAVFPGYSKRQLNRILNNLANVTPSAEASRLSLEFLPLRFFSTHALLVMLSTVASGDWSFFPRLRAHGNQGLLISPDPIDFARETFTDDTPNRLAVRAARVERRLELQKIARLHIRVIDWQVDEPLAPLVRSTLSRVRGQHE